MNDASFTDSIALVPGPAYGSFIAQFSSQWRWSMWTLTIWSFLDLVALFVFAPETFAPAIERKRTQNMQDSAATRPAINSSPKVSILANILANLKKLPLLLFHEPMLTLLCLWTGLMLGIIYLFFELFRESCSLAHPLRSASNN
jgi:MFS family permease